MRRYVPSRRWIIWSIIEILRIGKTEQTCRYRTAKSNRKIKRTLERGFWF